MGSKWTCEKCGPHFKKSWHHHRTTTYHFSNIAGVLWDRIYSDKMRNYGWPTWLKIQTSSHIYLVDSSSLKWNSYKFVERTTHIKLWFRHLDKQTNLVYYQHQNLIYENNLLWNTKKHEPTWLATFVPLSTPVMSECANHSTYSNLFVGLDVIIKLSDWLSKRL